MTDVAPAMEVVATAGHVDHGKSALLKRLTGMEPDRWDEERRRGLTIDLGYVWAELETPEGEGVTVAFVDVPGHDGFLTNMLCGVGVVGQVLFVVAADDGWSAQSQEHLEILDVLRRFGVAVAVTKIDLAGPDRTADVIEDVERRLTGTSLQGTPVVAVDSLSGAGLDDLRSTLAARLTSRDSAADAGGDDIDPRTGETATRLWIDRAFTVTGAGTIVTGLLIAGQLAVGDEVVVAPAGLRARVRSLQSLERPVDAAASGARVAVNLAGIEPADVGRGDVLLAATGPVSSRTTRLGTTSLDARLEALPSSTIGRKGAWHLHVGTATTTVTVHPLLGDIGPGEAGHARIELNDPLPIRIGDRFILREAGRRRTVGGGTVLDPAPGPRPRGAERRLDHALALDELADATETPDLVAALVDTHGGRRDHAQLSALLGRAEVVDQAVATSPSLTVLAGQVVRSELVAPWTEAMLATAEAAPAEHAISRALLVAAAVEQGCPRELAEALLDGAVTDGELASHSGQLVHHRNEPGYLDARARRREAFLAVLDAEPLQPPDPADATGQVDMPTFEVQALLDEGTVVSCGPLLFTATAISDAEARLRDGPGRGGEPFTAGQARNAWATTRRAAVPLLEHQRTTGVTSFDGTHHRLVQP